MTTTKNLARISEVSTTDRPLRLVGRIGVGGIWVVHFGVEFGVGGIWVVHFGVEFGVGAFWC